MDIAIPVIRTKIVIPRRRSEILSRPRLLSILENILDLKLLILAAPAGYGKTSLLIDFSHHSQLPVCWFAIDTLDVDPQRFIAHFIAAIANSFPSFGEVSRAALRNMDPQSLNLDSVISAIINDVYDHVTEHFVFILDDYHCVRESKPIDEFINRMALEMSENCHFIISSRTLLTIPDLTLLVSRFQVGGLSYEELAFMPEEIKQLISVNYHQTITEKTAQELVEQTEGWITGLLLSAQLSPKANINRLRLARVSGIGLYEYMAQQVLELQSPDLVLFLKRTSLLEEFDAKLCETIFSKVEGIEKQNWKDKVEGILRENLFVLPVDDETLYLRYHHLFRDFLQNRMLTERPVESRRIELELARYYEERKEWERSFAIYSRLKDDHLLTDFILHAAPSMILGGRLSALSSWIERLPVQIREEQPEILSIRGSIAMLKGDSKNSLSILDKAIDGLRDKGNLLELTTTLIRRSYVNRFFGHYDQALTDAKEAIKLSNANDQMRKVNAEALRSIGFSFYQSGQLKKALVALTESLNKFHQLGEEQDAAKVWLDLGTVHLSLGNLDECENAFQKSYSYWQATQNSLWQTNLLNNLGVVQHLRGMYEQAAVSFEKALTHARLASNPRLEGFSLTSLGDLYRDIRALTESKRAYELAQDAMEMISDQALQVYRELSLAALARISGDQVEYHASLSRASDLAEKGGSEYEIHLCLLEKCFSNILQNQLVELVPRLTNLVDFFTKSGFHVETLRSEYLLFLVQLLSHPDKKNEDTLLEYAAIHKQGRDCIPFFNVALETIEKLLEYQKGHQNIPGIDALVEEVIAFEKTFAGLRKTIRRHSQTVQFSTPKFVIRAFGKTQVKIGDHVVTVSEWKTQLVRDLFFFILAHGEGVTKEDIGEVFWPESTMDMLKLRFKNTIYRLRHALGSESITFIDDYYRFNRALEYDYDVEIFMQELSQAQKAQSAEDRIHHYRNALNQYRGFYLPKMDYEWVLIQREQYRRVFIGGVTQLMDLLARTEQFEVLIQYADKAIEEDPCFEDAYRAAMQAFSRLGDRSSILRYYEKCRNALKHELEIEPSPQTKALYETLIH